MACFKRRILKIFFLLNYVLSHKKKSFKICVGLELREYFTFFYVKSFEKYMKSRMNNSCLHNVVYLRVPSKGNSKAF